MTSSRDSLIKALDRQLTETDDPFEKANIYFRAAEIYSESSEIDEACFFMTQAFILAAHNGDNSMEEQARRFLKKNERI